MNNDEKLKILEQVARREDSLHIPFIHVSYTDLFLKRFIDLPFV